MRVDDIADEFGAGLEKIFLVKSKAWEYEREYRIFCRNGEIDKAPKILLCKNTGDFLDLTPGAISRIIIGDRADHAAVRQIVQDSGAGVGLARAVLDERSYKITVF